MAITVSKIKKASDTSWTTLETPITIKPSLQVLDSSESGRDNNTGVMYRDIVRTNVMTVECTLPAGLSNTQMATILGIILSPAYNMYLPDIKTGTFTGTRKFYTASAEPEIDIIKSETYWEYKEFTFKAIEY